MTTPHTLKIDNQTIQLTESGYLVNPSDWTPAVARRLAEHDKLILSEAHWQVINFLRTYYNAYHDTPAIRALVKALKEKFGPTLGNSAALQQLFPDGPAKQASKLAGLPKPKRCL